MKKVFLKRLAVLAAALIILQVFAACGNRTIEVESISEPVTASSLAEESSASSSPEPSEESVSEPEEASEEDESDVAAANSEPEPSATGTSQNASGSAAESSSTASQESSESSTASSAGESNIEDELAAVSQPATNGANAFSITPSNIFSIFVFNPNSLTYGYVGNNIDKLYQDGQKVAVVDAINALPTLENYRGTVTSAYTSGFLFFDKDGVRHSYNLTPGVLCVDDVNYYLPQAQYNKLVKLLGETTVKSNHAQWAVWMNAGRVTGVSFTDESGKKTEISKEKNLAQLAAYLKNVTVSSGQRYAKGAVPLEKPVTVVLTFDKGNTYTIAFSGKEMTIESSDIVYGCYYKESEYAQLVKKLQEAAK